MWRGNSGWLLDPQRCACHLRPELVRWLWQWWAKVPNLKFKILCEPPSCNTLNPRICRNKKVMLAVVAVAAVAMWAVSITPLGGIIDGNLNAAYTFVFKVVLNP